MCDATLYVYFDILWYINSFHLIHTDDTVHSFAEVSLQLLCIAGQLNGKNLPGVPSRESNSGLPYS